MAPKNETPADADKEEAEGAEAKDAAAPKRRFSLKLIIMVAGGVVGLAAIGGGGYFFFGHHGNTAAAATTVKPPIFVDMPDVLVNLSNPASERTQYLKVKIVLEVPDSEVVTQIQPLMPRVMDAFQTYLRELRPTDLDGSAGLYRLKEELTRRVNAAVSPNRITAVLFKEIVVQ